MRQHPRRLAGVLTVATAVAAVVATVTAGASPSQAAAGQAKGCAPAVFYGVKGSAENSSSASMGPTISTLASLLKTDLAGSVRMTVVPVSYPAVSALAAIDGGLFNGTNYQASRDKGVAALSSLVIGQLVKCPDTRLVLAGYSQGADVVGKYLASGLPSLVTSHIAGVAMLGDPRFNPASTSIDAGSFNPKYGPIFGKFPLLPAEHHAEGRRKLLPAALRGATISVCDKGDMICNYTWSNAVHCFRVGAWARFYPSIVGSVVVPVPELSKSCPHFLYPDKDTAPATAGGRVTDTAVARFLAARLARWSGSTPPVPPGGTSDGGAWLSQVSCASAAFCGATGSYLDAAGNAVGLLETLSGGRWTAQEAPLPADASPEGEQGVTMSSVSCPSAGTCVIAGEDNYSPPDASSGEDGVLETLSGGTWKVTSVPVLSKDNYDIKLASISCPSATSCAVAGIYIDAPAGDHPEGLLMTLSGGKWHVQRAPLPSDAVNVAPMPDVPPTELMAVTCASAGRCVAVGQYTSAVYSSPGVVASYLGRAVIETLSGGKWADTRAPQPAGAGSEGNEAWLSAVSCPSAAWCVAAGDTENAGNDEGLLETLSKGKWSLHVAGLPAGATNGAAQLQVACASAGNCRGSGYYTTRDGNWEGLAQTLAGGRWQAAAVPAPAGSDSVVLNALSCGSAASCVAVGQGWGAKGLLRPVAVRLAG
ncbi:MAG TPA: cutinase family protein [Streptosporangiaceae bacterium]|jgi:hypothetical protein